MIVSKTTVYWWYTLLDSIVKNKRRKHHGCAQTNLYLSQRKFSQVSFLNDLEPMDLHAWFEAYVAGRWFTFDATQADLSGSYVIIGYGRDAADVAIYNQFGPSVFLIKQTVSVRPIEKSFHC